MGDVNGLKGFILGVSGNIRFKAGPRSGKKIAELIAIGKASELIKPFALSRFQQGGLVGEKEVAAVSH